MPGVSSTADIDDALTNFEFGSDEASPLKPGDPRSDAEKLRDATASRMAQEWQKGRGAARMGEPTAADRVGMAWEKLVKTTGQVADYTIKLPIDFAGAAYDFGRNYYDMRNANYKLSDKYFHAKANFQATHRGPGGQYFAEHFSNLREIWDQNIKGDPRLASELDQKANSYGRTQAKYFAPNDYREALKIYRPALLPIKY
jgi:serum amyloid A protein